MKAISGRLSQALLVLTLSWLMTFPAIRDGVGYACETAWELVYDGFDDFELEDLNINLG